MRDAHPGADFLIHPECGCSTSVMEYVAAGDVAAEGVHMLSTGGMLGYARGAAAGSTAIVATETGMLHPLRELRPDVDFVAANEARQLPLHEDDHAAEAARHAARRCRRRSRCPRRSPSAPGCRSSGWSRSASGVEQLGPVRPEVHEVLVADAEAARHVDAGLDTEDVAGLQRLGVAGPQVRRLVDLEADAVARAVEASASPAGAPAPGRRSRRRERRGRSRAPLAPRRRRRAGGRCA